MPLKDDAFDNERAKSQLVALEQADQHSADLLHKRAVQGLCYMNSEVITGLPEGETLWLYTENPSSEEQHITQYHPSIQSDTILELSGYFNPTIDTGTFVQTTANNLNSGIVDQFQGDTWSGNSNDGSVVADTGNQFFHSIVGTGGPTGAGGGLATEAVATIEPGDSLLMEIDHSITSGSATVAFQLPQLESTDDFTMRDDGAIGP